MHPKVHATYQDLAEKYEMKGPFLEIGVGNREAAILSGSYFAGKAQRFATNLAEKELVEDEDDTKIQFIRCNSQNMRDVFTDGQFGTVLSNAVIEHDKYFWRSLDEMKRILAPGGILAIGAPAYLPRQQIKGDMINEKFTKATVTMDVHSTPDYWRFSRMAFKEVVCEGLEILEISTIGRVPVLMAIARKPLDGVLLPAVAQEDRLKVLQVEKEEKLKKREAKLKEQEAEGGSRLDENGELRKVGPAVEAKRAARAARIADREVRQAARKAKAEAGPAEASAPEGGLAKRLKNKLKGLRGGKKAAADDGDADEDSED